MSSPMVTDGIYYSRMEECRFMWAFVNRKKSENPAHFGNSTTGPYQVIRRSLENTEYVHVPSEKKYLIIPKGMYKW